MSMPKTILLAFLSSILLAGGCRQEIDAGHEWAGTYWCGDGLGFTFSMTLMTNHQFEHRWMACAPPAFITKGTFVFTNGEFHLVFEDKEGDGGVGPCRTYGLVKWSGRTYLLPGNDVVKFANAINSGMEPRDSSRGSVFLRSGDEAKRIKGNPSIPPQYNVYLLKKPIAAEIVSVDGSELCPSRCGWNLKKVLVSLNRGLDDGLLEGMELYTDSADPLEVTSAQAKTAQAVLTQFDEKEPDPSPGLKLSTSLFHAVQE